MTLKERRAVWRKRRSNQQSRIGRLDAKIRTRVARLAARPALAAYIAREFNLRVTSTWRSVQHNADVGGVPGSWHTRGSLLKPGATDWVGSMADMRRAHAWIQANVKNLDEVMIHNVGSGDHLHAGGWGVASWTMPRRGLLKKWRSNRADARAKKREADARIADLNRQIAAQTGPARGIDVSNHQGRVDFQKVKADGYSFVWVKSSEGATWTDPTFFANVKAAKAAGLKVGAYHFVRPQAGRSGAVESQFFNRLLKQAGLGKGDLLPVLDIESTMLPPDATGTYATQAYRELKRLTGVTPVIYTFPFFRPSWPAALKEAPLWIADFRGRQAPTVPKPWTDWAAWQHTDHGRVNGVSTPVDLNKTDNIKELIA